MSLNLLFYGFQPQKPLSEYIAKSGDDAINAEFIPQLSRKPIAVCQGEIVYCMLAELKADWKFHKDFLQHVYVYVCMDYTPKMCKPIFFMSQELFNLRCGWNSAELCHHCFVQKDNYLNFPSVLHQNPRRDVQNFVMLAKGNDPCHLHVNTIYLYACCKNCRAISTSDLYLLF